MSINSNVGLVSKTDPLSWSGRWTRALVSSLGESQITVYSDSEATISGLSLVSRSWSANDFYSLEQRFRSSAHAQLHIVLEREFLLSTHCMRFLETQHAAGVELIIHCRFSELSDTEITGLKGVAARFVVESNWDVSRLIDAGVPHQAVQQLELWPSMAQSSSKQAVREAKRTSEHATLLVIPLANINGLGAGELFRDLAHAATAIEHNVEVVFLANTQSANAQQLESFRSWLEHSENAKEAFLPRLEVVGAEAYESWIGAADLVLLTGLHQQDGADAWLALEWQTPVLANRATSKTIYWPHQVYWGELSLSRMVTWLVGDNQIREAQQRTQVKWLARRQAAVKEDVEAIFATPVTPQFVKKAATKPIRVLMQNRSTAYTHRGGDTVVMDRIAGGLREQGVDVTIDLESKYDPKDFDLVHLYNFATPQVTEAYARRCVEAETPYVVHTMYEDLPLFYNQMHAFFQAVEHYVKAGQPREVWPELERIVNEVTPSGRFENSWTARHAEALITAGVTEGETLKRDYPFAKHIENSCPGCDIPESNVAPEKFIQETGIKDFVLCVGRLETRKNQLALLKALEDSELPLVFVGGGFSYQPEYVEVCKAFKRKGETHFFGRLDDDMLVSAYKAARVHALPSWYELPGIVSQEAARYGTNLVVTPNGTTRDLFGDEAFYCEPGDVQSIRDAVERAFNAPFPEVLRERLEAHTWERVGEQMFALYKRILGQAEQAETQKSIPNVSIDFAGARAFEASVKQALSQAKRTSQTVSQIQKCVPEEVQEKSNAEARQAAKELCDEADDFVRAKQYELALSQYDRALKTDNTFSRPERGIGVVYLQQGEVERAKETFSSALEKEPTDGRSLVGLANCHFQQGEKQEAYSLYERALELNPTDLPVLFNFINVSYALGRLEELEAALRSYLSKKPKDTQILYCLAGCLYKAKQPEAARIELEKLFEIEPSHEGGKELEQMLNSETTPAEDADIAQLKKLKEEGENGKLVSAARTMLESTLSEETKARVELTLAEALAKQGELFDTLSEVEVVKARALTGKGALLAARQAWSEAKECFEAALEIDDSCDSAHAGLGVCAMGATPAKNEVAWDHFEKALSINAENRRALYGIVQLGYALQRLQATASHLENFLALHPANLDVLYSYAGAQYALGNKNGAKDSLSKIRIFEPEHELARELWQKIETEAGSAGASV